MQPIDTIAIVGEVLSWIGLGIGIPVLLLAGMIRIAEGPWERIDLAIIDRDAVRIVRWFAGGGFHERPLRNRELTDAEWHHGFVSSRDPNHVRLSPPMLCRVLTTLGIVFAVVGAVGFVVSFLPAFL